MHDPRYWGKPIETVASIDGELWRRPDPIKAHLALPETYWREVQGLASQAVELGGHPDGAKWRDRDGFRQHRLILVDGDIVHEATVSERSSAVSGAFSKVLFSSRSGGVLVGVLHDPATANDYLRDTNGFALEVDEATSGVADVIRCLEEYVGASPEMFRNGHVVLSTGWRHDN